MKRKLLLKMMEPLVRLLLVMMLMCFYGSQSVFGQIYNHNFNNQNLSAPTSINANVTSAWTSTGGSLYFRDQGLAILGHNHTYILNLKVANGFEAEITSISLRRFSADNATFQILVNSVGYGTSFSSNTTVTGITRTKTVSKLRNTVSIAIYVANSTTQNQNYSQIDDLVINGTVTAYDPASEALPDANGVLYVDKSLSTPGDGSSWDKALKEVSQAIRATARPIGVEQIWVAEGTYSPAANASFSMVERVKIYGGFEGGESEITERDVLSNQTILKGNGTSVIYNDGIDNTALLDGFYIQDGTGFLGTSTSNGGGMYNTSSNPVVSNCIFTDNESNPAKANARGGAMFNLNSNPTVLQCIFAKNKASGTAQSRGGAIYNENSSPLILNCTITDNNLTGGTALGGGICNTGSSAPTIQNCIIWNNAIDGIGTVTGSTGAPNVSYNLIQGGFAGSANTVDADPQFTNAGAGDYRTLTASPAINAGNPATDLTLFPINADGKPADITAEARVLNFKVDLGAFETGRPTIWHVSASSNAVNPQGETWADAFKTLQEALMQANAGDQIWVGKGEYMPAPGSSFSMIPGVKFYGGFQGQEATPEERPLLIPRGTDGGATILKGNGARVINNDQNELTENDLLDRFTVIGGADYQGAGMYNGNVSLRIVNCSFINNMAESSGGGIYNNSSNIQIQNTLFTGNKAIDGSGGALRTYGGSSTISNCVFSKNLAPTGGGGALSSNNATVLLYQSTIYLNSSQYDAALSCSYNDQIGIYGSIIFGNSSGVSQESSNPANIYLSLVQGYGTNTSNRNLDGDIDPQFVNADGSDLRLRSCSPAINRSSSQIVTEGDKDMDGKERVYNLTPDMGAYEFQGLPTPISIPMGNESTTLAVFAGITAISEDCETLVNIEPSGVTPLAAYIAAKVYVTAGQTLVSGKKVFVKRHFDLTPTVLIEPGDDANVTLFFTKQEFDDYNTAYGAANNARLPDNLKIVQYHGTSPSGLPETYSGGMEIIDDVAVTLLPGGSIYMVTFAVTSFSGFFVTGQSEGALPVTLTAFRATKNENKAVLSWSTSTESNSAAFGVEHSLSGKIWNMIGQVAARGDVVALTDYSFVHGNPENGENLYRLKMIDKDGSFSYSRVNSLNFGHPSATALYPNPAIHVRTVKVKGVLPGDITELIWYDGTGKIIHTSTLPLSDEIDVTNLLSGTYVVHIILKNGVTQSAKLVVTK